MRIHFRPLPVLTLFATLGFALLVSLGVWQIHRLHWKLGLIAEVNRSMHLPPVSLDAALALGGKAEYRKVALTGHFENAKEAYVYTTGPHGMPVYHVLTPFVTDGGRTLMVDRGMVLPELRNPKKREAGQLQGERRIIAVWRTPDAPGLFTPKPDIAHRIWFSRNVEAIATADHVKLAAPVLLEADAAPNPGGWPKGGQTVVHLRNHHLEYAGTWFGLAVALLGIYLSYHIRYGRLTFGRRDAL